MSEQRYGWAVVAAAFALMFIGFASAYSFAAFFGAFQAEFGASRGNVALVFSLAAFTWFVCGAPAGMAADRFGARRVALAGVACLAAALWLSSMAASVFFLYAAYSIGIGLGVGLVYVPSVGAVQPWFQANRALASGLAIAGIGAGNTVGPLLAALLIERAGWRTSYQVLSILFLAIGLAAAAALRERHAGRPRSQAPGRTLAQALGTREFWLLYGSLFLTCIGLFVPMVHLGPYAQDAGYSEAQGVALVSLIGVGSLAGRFAVGPFADRLGRERSLAFMYAGLGAMLLVWWASSAYGVLAVFAVVFGSFYGAYVALLPTIVMDLYGPRAVSGIIGALYTGAGLGTLIGPWLAGVAYDAFHSYQAPILAAAALSFVAAACVLPMLKHEKAALVDRG
ncbi:MAG TPA: MFS transporter [Burkholderiales bacterium]|nr:MFS transporter [Burkholderiales bacterium]